MRGRAPIASAPSSAAQLTAPAPLTSAGRMPPAASILIRRTGPRARADAEHGAGGGSHAGEGPHRVGALLRSAADRTGPRSPQPDGCRQLPPT
ncbi:hypothetical protein SHIRM173S_07129 [Streptomyces hirsutus]